jgi:hypothetical protein
MSAADRDWPVMTFPLELICVTEEWRYDSACGDGYGLARLALWRAPVGHVAMVSDLGIGASVTNSAENVWAALVVDYPGPLVLLEHYPGGAQGGELDEEHIDQADVVDGQPRWRRIWPIRRSHPLYDELHSWVEPLQALTSVPGGAR